MSRASKPTNFPHVVTSSVGSGTRILRACVVLACGFVGFSAPKVLADDAVGVEDAAASAAPQEQVAVADEGPRVSDTIPGRLSLRGATKYCLVKNARAAIPPEALVISTAHGAGATIECNLKAVTGDWEIFVNKKKVAKVTQDGSELTLRTMATDDGLLDVLGYLVLELRLSAGKPALAIPLGQPIKTTLHVHPTRDKKVTRVAVASSSTSGGSDSNAIEGFREDETYALFENEDAQKSLASLLATFPDLYEQLEFGGQAGVTSRSVPGRGRTVFTLADQMGRGVVLRRTDAGLPRYKRDGLTFPLAYGELSEKFKGMTVFGDDLLKEIPRSLKADIAAAESDGSVEAYDRRSKLRSAGRNDLMSLVAAKAFPLSAVQGCGVRLTLRQPGKEGGFVVVDSLPPAPSSHVNPSVDRP